MCLIVNKCMVWERECVKIQSIRVWTLRYFFCYCSYWKNIKCRTNWEEEISCWLSMRKGCWNITVLYQLIDLWGLKMRRGSPKESLNWSIDSCCRWYLGLIKRIGSRMLTNYEFLKDLSPNNNHLSLLNSYYLFFMWNFKTC